MNFTNINDPVGVQALLDQLRSSQAWQEISAPASDTLVESPSGSSLTTGRPESSVASLLSQLQNVTTRQTSDTLGREHIPPTISEHIPYDPPPPIKNAPDLKSLSFQKALPYIAQLAEDPTFIASIAKMKKEQDDLERALWDDRSAIYEKYNDKVKIAKTKAVMIGSNISPHEAEMITNAFRKELQKFDQERVLPAWDGLIAKQQTSLEQLGVPTMFTAQERVSRERQQRVIQILESLDGSPSNH